ncbi:MAG: hypothetical protein OCC45_04625 [Desulfotalea sp.]
MNFEKIAQLRKYLSVKHSLPGRLRVKFAKKILTDATVLSVIDSGFDLPKAVKKTKINLFSGSLLIEYDAKKVSQSLLEGLINANTDEEAEHFVSKLHQELYN